MEVGWKQWKCGPENLYTFIIGPAIKKYTYFLGLILFKLDAMHTTLPSGLKITTTQKQINFLTVTFFYLFNRLISFLQFPMSASLYSNSHFLKKSEKTKHCNAMGEKYNLITFCGCLLQASGMFKQLLRKKSLSKNGQMAMISVIMKEVDENITEFNTFIFFPSINSHVLFCYFCKWWSIAAQI